MNVRNEKQQTITADNFKKNGYLMAKSTIWVRLILFQAEFFEPAMNALLERHPKFAPIHNLKSSQVQTLWEVPSRLRRPLRRMLDPDPSRRHPSMHAAVTALGATVTEMAEGEVLQLRYAGRLDTTVEQYMEHFDTEKGEMVPVFRGIYRRRD